MRGACCWGLLLLFLGCSAPTQAANNRQFFSFKVESRDALPASSRRGLLRNATLPLHGAVKDYGYFYAAMYLGTPPRKFAVIVDTGSTMTYVPCASCGTGCGPNHQSPAFDPGASSTATRIGCGSAKCTCGSPRCSCSGGQCTYTRSYAEQSSSSGVLVEDLLSLHDGDAGAPIIFGCETRETGEIYKQRADGLFGLGNSDVSVINQLVNSGVIENVFSLCFGTVEGEGAMLLGDAPLPSTLRLQYTPLVSSLAHPFYYNVKLEGLVVGGRQLPLQEALFQQGYGTVLDSGTTFTYLPTAAFQAFAAAVERHALARGLYKVPGPDPSYEDICFGGAPDHHNEAGLQAVFPPMGLLFDQMEPLTLSPLNYLFVHTFNSGKYCLGVFDNGGAGTLLGGITFRNVLVRYDRAARRVGFSHATCRDLGQAQRPPCSVLATEGIAADEAAASGDCQPVPPRSQQQEQYHPEESDPPANPKPSSSGGTSGGGDSSSTGPQSSSSSSIEGSSSWSGGGAQEGQGGSGGVEGPSSQGSSRDATATAASTGGGESVGPRGEGVDGSSSSSYHKKPWLIGLLVGLAAGAAVVLAAVLLRPAGRERLRGALQRLRPYRPLSGAAGDDSLDPEANPILGAGSGAAGGDSAAAAVGGALSAPPPGGSSPERPKSRGNSSPRVLKMVPLVEMATPAGEKRMGLTTPTKLQRQASAAAAAAASAAAAAAEAGSTSPGGSAGSADDEADSGVGSPSPSLRLLQGTPTVASLGSPARSGGAQSGRSPPGLSSPR